jgi:hypothetical protein
VKLPESAHSVSSPLQLLSSPSLQISVAPGLAAALVSSQSVASEM